MTRILTITNWYPPHHYGGYELACFDVMTRLIARGHDVRVLCSDERLSGAVLLNADHERLVHRELRLYWRDGDLYTPRFRERLALERHNHRVLERHLASHSPDVVAIWHMGAMSLGLLRTLSDRGLPIVYAVCDDWLTYIEKQDAWVRPFAPGPLRRFAGRLVEAITGVPTRVDDLGASGSFCFVSNATRRRALAYSRWTYPRSTVVYVGVDRSQFRNRDGEAERQWQWRLLFTGRFERRKGIEALLRALPLLPPEATLHCDGRSSAEEQSHLVRLASGLRVSDRVTFGTRDRHELATLYQEADVLVFPSEWEEPFGLVPIEAMACGTPVVATGVGGSGEFLRDGYNCVLFAAGDPIALADAVYRLSADPELRCRVVSGGLRTAERLDIEFATDAFEDWYVAAAENFAHGRPVERELDLPHSTDDSDGARSSTETARVVADRLGNLGELVLYVGRRPASIASMRSTSRPEGIVVAVDAHEDVIREACRIAPPRGESLVGVVGQVARLPFRDGTFDGLACDNIDDSSDDVAELRDLARVLQPHGLAILATPNRDNAQAVRGRVIDRLRGTSTPPAFARPPSSGSEKTWNEFERWVEPVFRVRTRHPVGWDRGWKGRVATMLVRSRPLRRFSQAIVLEVERA